MSFDLSGAVLEGVRLSTSVNSLVFPPKNLIDSQASLDLINFASEYCLIVSGQSEGSDGIYINDPNLVFKIVKNDSITRFGYDYANRRWFSSPGSIPKLIGPIRNNPRLVVPVPKVLTPNYQIYLNLPRVFSFNVVIVDVFGSPPAGTVEILKSNGQLNFSAADLSDPNLNALTVVCNQSDFFTRPQVSGALSKIAEDGSYLAYMNPIPLASEFPFLRVGFRKYFNAVAFPNESVMPSPSTPNTINYSLDTGRVLIYDPSSYINEGIYYDGVVSFTRSFSQNLLGTFNPNVYGFVTPIGVNPAFVGLIDSERYVFWAKGTSLDKSYFLNVVIGTVIPTRINVGEIFINKNTGTAYVSTLMASSLINRECRFLDTYIVMEDGVIFKPYRSGANGIGNPKSYDFFEYYNIENSLISESVTPSPYVFLPITPLNDSSLSYRVDSGPSSAGTFVGPLNPISDTTKNGFCYYLEYEPKRLTLANRGFQVVTFETEASTIKLPVSSVIDQNVVVKRNGTELLPNQYNLDPSFGTITFLKSEGESSALNAIGVLGDANGSSFSTNNFSFNSSYAGSYLFVSSGDNIGFFKITFVLNANTVNLDTSFKVNGPQTVDIKSTKETVANRVWRTLNPPMKSFKVELLNTSTGLYEEFSQEKYSVVAQVGLVSLKVPADPDQTFRATYKYATRTNGIITGEASTTEFLASKIRLEQVSFSPGSRIVTFNPDGKTVLPAKGFKLVIDGVTQDASKFTFISPNKIDVGIPLNNELVLLDYWIAECVGGNITFNLSNPDLIVDYPRFESNLDTSIFNGNQTDTIKVSSLVYVNKSDLYLVTSSSYDQSSDKTTVVFSSKIKSSYTGAFQVSEPVNFSILGLNLTIPNNARNIILNGNVNIPVYSCISINSDYFYVISKTYNADNDKTTIYFSASTAQNYVNPVIKLSDSSVYPPSKQFTTKKSAVITSPFTLFLGGSNPRLLLNLVDYTISDGGTIFLKNDLLYGQTLEACYVSRDIQPVGTELLVNCAFIISPDIDSNGLLSQYLLSTYNVYSPDTFYYRDLTIKEFVPETINYINSNSVGLVTSGPNLVGAPAFKNADNGVPSLYFSQQQFNNFDIVARRFLLYFNNLVNFYEDLLSNLDGRVVGGISGKFRFNNQSSTVSAYEDITNDIDDYVRSYDLYGLSNLNPFTVDTSPFYTFMYEYNSLSRLFPTRISTNFVVNDKTGAANNGQVLGNIGYTNITSMKEVFSARASSIFTRSDNFNIVVPSNGDVTTLSPAFIAPSRVYVYDDDGVFISSNVINVISGTNPIIFTMADPITVPSGFIILDNTDFSGLYSNRLYFPNTDFALDNDTGTITNNSQDFLIAFNFQRQIFPDEILSTSFTFNNKSSSPRLIPVLEGSTLNDDGFVSFPPLKRYSELASLNTEINLISEMTSGSAKVSNLNTISDCSLVLDSGDEILFTEGPNANLVRTVINLGLVGTYGLTVPLNVIDLTARNIIRKATRDNYVAAVQREINIIGVNLQSNPVPPKKIGNINNELLCFSNIAQELGEVIFDGTGIVGGDLVTISTANFGTLLECYISIESGPNIGIYQILSNTATTLTVNTSAPFYGFTAPGSNNIKIIRLYNFLTEGSPEYLAQGIRNTNVFYNLTSTYINNINYSDFSIRLSQIAIRLQEVNSLIVGAETILKSADDLYGARYSWISLRTDKISGFLSRRDQAIFNRQLVTKNLRENQKRIAIMNS